MALHIGLLTPEHIDAAKAVIRAGCMEFFGAAPANFEDVDQIPAQYSAPSGIFLVLLDGDVVVGTGAIRRLDDRTCELKRMWFLPAYRGRGYGTQMAQALLAFARAAGYERVRLDTVPALQAANRLYRRLGFYDIERYNSGPGAVFMEKTLNDVRTLPATLASVP